MALESCGCEGEHLEGRFMVANGDMKELWDKVAKLSEQGCALRGGDIERMARMEKQNDRIHSRLDWITVLMVGNLAALALNLASKWLGK